MNGYIALYRGRKHELYADTLFAAKQKAVEHFKAKKPHEVTVYLAEKDGQPVTQMPTS